MKIADTRRSNLRALAEIHGSAKLAALLGYRQPSFLSQMIGPNPSREVSEKSARQYEAALELPEGYLDKPLFPDSAIVPATKQSEVQVSDVADVQATSIALLADTIRDVSTILSVEKIDVTVDQFAKLLRFAALDAAEHGNKVRVSHVKQMLELIK